MANPFSDDFQHSLINLMFRDSKFLVKCLHHLSNDHFNNERLAWIFDSIKEHHDEYDECPRYTALEDMVMKHDPKHQSAYFELIEKIKAADTNFPDDYIRNNIKAFTQRVKFVDAYKRSADIFNSSSDGESAYEVMAELISEINSIDFDGDDVVDFSNPMDYIEKARSSTEHSIPTGIEEIDKAMGGGLSPGSLTTIISTTSGGKSMALVNIAYAAMRAGKKVIYVVHEDEETPTVCRVISRMTNIPFNKLIRSSEALTDGERKRIEAAGAMAKEYLCMKFMYGSETTVEEVRDWLILKKQEFDFDLIIDDYGQFIRTRQKTDGERFTQAIVYRTFNQIALQTNTAFLSVAQGNRMAQKSAKAGVGYLRSSDLAECFEIARVSGNIITLNRSDKMQENNELIYYLEKNRNGRVGIAVRCETDYSRCRTHSMTGTGQYLHNSTDPLLSLAKAVNPEKSAVAKEAEKISKSV